MECLSTIKNLEINKNKKIGEVVILVEGESEEFKLLKHIFTKILNYNYHAIRRNKIMHDKFVSKSNNNSTVIIANTTSSNIKSIMEDDNYKDKLYELLKKEYNKNLKNVPIYILWDRDYDSNDSNVVKKSLETFGSSLDNEYDMNGLLLLSYPCIESFELSNFDKKLWKKRFKTSDEVKREMNSIVPNIHSINEQTLLLAIENLNRTLKMYGINSYDPSYFKDINMKVYNSEESEYVKNKVCNALSLIGIMLIDLGIINEKEKN